MKKTYRQLRIAVLLHLETCQAVVLAVNFLFLALSVRRTGTEPFLTAAVLALDLLAFGLLLSGGQERMRMRQVLRLCFSERFQEHWLGKEEAFEASLRNLNDLLCQMSDMKYNQELLLIRAKMSALKNQINPHFLYNTLDVIRSYALMQDCREVAEMTEALSTMFRYSISKPDDVVTVEEELDNVKNYFLIQQYRFGDKFRLEIEWEDESDLLRKCILPRLSIQPLVENSIHHGLERKAGVGKIGVYIYRTEKDLCIRVRDNGLGMDAESLRTLQDRLEHETALSMQPKKDGKSGIAVVNLNQRLKLFFGEEYGVHVSSLVNVGTFFLITLPLYTRREWAEKVELDEKRAAQG